MLNWDKLRIFHTVAEAGSFTHAGERLHITQSSISRQIGALEQSLGVALFHRHARGLALTEQGETLYQTAQELATRVRDAEAAIGESLDRPSGPLRITTSVAFGSMWLTERLKDFVDMYPEIEISLIVREDQLNLSMRQADVAIRLERPEQPDLIQRPLFTLKHAAYAAPDYLERWGMPYRLEDLAAHKLLAYDETYYSTVTNVNWLLDAASSNSKGHYPALRVNNIYGIFRACAAGMGIASLPDYMANMTSGLVPVLPEHEGPKYQAYFVYPEEMRNSRRIVVLRDFLLRRIKEDKR